MKQWGKVMAGGLAVLLAFSVVSGCKKKETSETTGSTIQATLKDADGDTVDVNNSKEFHLSYSRSDSMNPFFAESLNNQLLSKLIYDSLFSLNGSFEAKNNLAASFTNNGAAVTVTLGSAQFTDGSSVSGADVVYSFNLAKKSPVYRSQLENVKSASASGKTVTFALTAPQPFAQNVLTFAIVKSGSGDKKEDTPVGSGRYKPTRLGSDYVLKYNAKHGGDKPSFEKIILVNASEKDSVANSLKIGNISFLYKDLSEGTYTRMTSKTMAVPLNNLVFLGINEGNKELEKEAVRQAISFALDRSAVVTSGYQGHALEATAPFQPKWSGLGQSATAEKKAQADKAAAALRAGTYGAQTTLALVVNKENKFRAAAANTIAGQLNAAGIKVKVNAVSFSDYQAAVAKGNFDLYLGEVRLTDDMSLSPFFAPGGSCAAGIGASSKEVKEAYDQWTKGTLDLKGFLTAFAKNTPFVPVVYRTGIVAYTNQMKGEVSSCYGDVFSNIQDWSL